MRFRVKPGMREGAMLERSTGGGTIMARNVPWDVLEHGWGNDNGRKRAARRAGARVGARNGHDAFPEACWRSPGASTGSATGLRPALRRAQGPAGWLTMPNNAYLCMFNRFLHALRLVEMTRGARLAEMRECK